MFGLLVLVSAIVIMSKTADMEGRSSTLWGFITFNICILCWALIPLPFFNLVIGLIISFMTLFAVKVIKK